MGPDDKRRCSFHSEDITCTMSFLFWTKSLCAISSLTEAWKIKNWGQTLSILNVFGASLPVPSTHLSWYEFLRSSLSSSKFLWQSKLLIDQVPVQKTYLTFLMFIQQVIGVSLWLLIIFDSLRCLGSSSFSLSALFFILILASAAASLTLYDQTAFSTTGRPARSKISSAGSMSLGSRFKKLRW